MRVAVAGAGLAGLALATGLARDGHTVVVLEADHSLTSRPQGYRLHVDRRGLDPLRALLPPADHAVVEATAGRFAEPRQLQVMSGRLHRLRTIETGPGVVDGLLVSTAVDRATLRAVLAGSAVTAGAEIRWRTTVSTYVEREDGVQVQTSGDAVEAHLLVGCDGVRSRVAARLLPALRLVDAEAGSIVGRTPATATPPRLLESLRHGYVVLRGLRTGVGLGLMAFAGRPDDVGRAAGRALAAVEDYVMWNVGLTRAAELTGATPDTLQRNALRHLRGWHPDVRAVVSAADEPATFLATSARAERPASWDPSRVTVIGDAAHAMPPDRGSGANLALADAARLVAALRDVDGADRAALLAAVGRTEVAMVDQAFGVSEAGPATGRR